MSALEHNRVWRSLGQARLQESRRREVFFKCHRLHEPFQYVRNLIYAAISVRLKRSATFASHHPVDVDAKKGGLVSPSSPTLASRAC
jgi:hypothetical protein